MVSSIIHCLRSLFWVITLLVNILFMFSIVFIQLSTDYRKNAGPEDEKTSAELANWFGSLGQGMFTLFKIVTGNSWDVMAETLEEVHPICVPALLFYVCFMLFAVLNIITGVFVEGAISSAQGERDAAMQEEMHMENERRSELKRLFDDLDRDHSGFIDLAEFETALEKAEFQACFRMLSLRLDDAWDIFRLIDQDGSQTVNLEEFISGCLKWSGSVKLLDLVTTLEDVKRSLATVHSSILGTVRRADAGADAGRGKVQTRTLPLDRVRTWDASRHQGRHSMWI